MHMKPLGITALLLSIVGSLTGCVTDVPQMLDGNYYMAGSSDCARGEVHPSGLLLCYDKHGNRSGSRMPMTRQQLAEYSIQQAYHKQEIQSLTDSIDKIGDDAQAFGQSINNSSGYNTTPQAPTWSNPAPGLVWCRKLGSYVVTCIE